MNALQEERDERVDGYDDAFEMEDDQNMDGKFFFSYLHV